MSCNIFVNIYRLMYRTVIITASKVISTACRVKFNRATVCAQGKSAAQAIHYEINITNSMRTAVCDTNKCFMLAKSFINYFTSQTVI